MGKADAEAEGAPMGGWGLWGLGSVRFMRAFCFVDRAKSRPTPYAIRLYGMA